MRPNNNLIRFLGLGCGLALMIAGISACQQKGGDEAETPERKTIGEFTGVVQTALGKFIYVPAASGFDIAVAGDFDTASLIDKEIRITGAMVENRPYIFRADTLEVKSESGRFESIYTRAEDLDVEDAFKLDTRQDFETLTITSPTNTQEWEGRNFGKVYGKLVKSDNGSASIAVLNEKDREVGRIIIDDMDEYARYYVQKLRLYDTFWFYLEIKDTVDRAVRTKTRELFKARVFFTGLF